METQAFANLVEEKIAQEMRKYVSVTHFGMQASFSFAGNNLNITMRMGSGPNAQRIGTSIRFSEEAISNGAETEAVYDIAEQLAKKAATNLWEHINTWIRIAQDAVDYKEAIQLTDIEQRRHALQRIGIEEILARTKAKLIDKSERGNELYQIPQSAGVFRRDAWYLKYQDPSTNRVYFSGVDPETAEETKSADACMAWKLRLTPEEYDMLEIEA